MMGPSRRWKEAGPSVGDQHAGLGLLELLATCERSGDAPSGAEETTDGTTDAARVDLGENHGRVQNIIGRRYRA